MVKKQVPRLPSENLPEYRCGECWFYEPETIEHGACYAIPPTVIIDEEGSLCCPRTIVQLDDRGCVHWKARHRV